MIRRPAIVVCETLRAEAVEALRAEGLGEVPVFCFPARCEGGVSLTAASLHRAARQHLELHVIGGSCLRALALRASDGAVSCTVHRDEQCFSLLARNQLVDALQAEGGYLVTPGWLARWREHLVRQGLAGDEGQAIFREGVDKLILLDTSLRAGGPDELEAMGAHLGLPVVRLPVSLDRLRERLREVIKPSELAALPPSLTGLDKAHAEYAMALDLLSDLAGLNSEDEILRRSAEVCALLMSPGSGACWRAVEGRLRLLHLWPPGAEPFEPPPLPPGSNGLARGRGLAVPVAYGGKLYGLLAAEEVLLPARLGDYLQVGRFVAGVAGLAIYNLRAVAERSTPASGALLTTICAYCKDVHEEDQWKRIEAFLAPRVQLSFSHGICPNCFDQHFGPGDPPEPAR